MIDGKPWFVAKDVCDILGLGNPTKALYGLDDDEKNTLTISKGTSGNPSATIISESGFYSLVAKSRKPQAKVFKRWVNQTLHTVQDDVGERESILWTSLHDKA